MVVQLALWTWAALRTRGHELRLSREGFEVLLEARWIRNVMPLADPSSDIVWQRETTGAAGLPFDDPDFAMFTGRRGFRVVAGGMFYRAEGVVGLSNVVADAADAEFFGVGAGDPHRGVEPRVLLGVGVDFRLGDGDIGVLLGDGEHEGDLERSGVSVHLG